MYTANSPIEYLPIVITVMVAGGFVTLTMIATHVLGPKRKSKIKDDVFECGIEAQGNARTPFSIKYFLAAILFVLFDVEVIFMYPWAVDLRNLSTLGFMEMISYLAVVFLGFLYILKKGALNWDVE